MIKYQILGTVVTLALLISCGIRQAHDGAPGVAGPTGASGQDGRICEVSLVQPSAEAPNGGSLIQCPTSAQLVLNGSPGSDGEDGTVITPKKLCPGETVYPSVFIEVAFCIDHNLYAVYSANNGFLTLIPPGSYSSNAIGSSCNLTVLPNCVIQ